MARVLFAEAGHTLCHLAHGRECYATEAALALSYQAACCDLLKHTSAFIIVMVADQESLFVILADFDG